MSKLQYLVPRYQLPVTSYQLQCQPLLATTNTLKSGNSTLFKKKNPYPNRYERISTIMISPAAATTLITTLITTWRNLTRFWWFSSTYLKKKNKKKIFPEREKGKKGAKCVVDNNWCCGPWKMKSHIVLWKLTAQTRDFFSLLGWIWIIEINFFLEFCTLEGIYSKRSGRWGNATMTPYRLSNPRVNHALEIAFM